VDLYKGFLMEDIFTFNAYLGSILLAICAAPLAYRAYHDGHSKGVDGLFLLIWTLGEIFTLSYVLYTWDLPLILNYGLNLVFIGVVVYYKLKPRRDDEG
jgi:uncharacterized protein with PQ loop repeat